jgi:hypothetical protein
LFHLFELNLDKISDCPKRDQGGYYNDSCKFNPIVHEDMPPVHEFYRYGNKEKNEMPEQKIRSFPYMFDLDYANGQEQVKKANAYYVTGYRKVREFGKLITYPADEP